MNQIKVYLMPNTLTIPL